jgi:hypothetical protein
VTISNERVGRMANQIIVSSDREERLIQLEAVIEVDYLAFVRVGNALLEIRKEKLYEEHDYNDFREYLEKRWKWHASFAYQQMNASFIHGYLTENSTIVEFPTNEGQTRPLTKLATFKSAETGRKDPEQWVTAWEDAVEIGNRDGGIVTDKHVNEAVNKVIKGDKSGELPPAPVWNGSYALNNIYVADTTTLDFLRSMPADSIDMMFSDPPWDEESLPLYEAAGRLAARVLKPGGWCALYAGKMFLPEIYSILSAWLDYEWTFCVFQPDNQHIMKGLYEAWRPIVLFKKPGERRKHNMLPDAYKSPREKGYHDWQQGHLPISKYIEAFTAENEIVIDPYVGGGTVPWVCQQLKRSFLAFDDDEEDVSISLARLRNGRGQA